MLQPVISYIFAASMIFRQRSESESFNRTETKESFLLIGRIQTVCTKFLLTVLLIVYRCFNIALNKTNMQ